ncbi:MAG: TIGR02281 family clan AA aspartic protease [Sphingobium sp.]|nr:TIGR02281 family clan AA aspartic protease [Sphingobium sp.]MCP5398913.1 TIGR02281 family clan AA aspartic protease [Sphingomonas sp.]
MSFDQGAHMLWYILIATVVISALMARRLPLRNIAGMAFAWIIIFGVILVAFSYREEFAGIGQRVKTELSGKVDQRAEGNSLHIKMSMDGHYWVDGQINGTSARFLIDSGATITGVSEDVALSAGLNIDNSGPGMMMETANGTAVAKRSSIPALTIGPITTSDLSIIVSDKFNGVNVLGMNFLSRLRSWRVENGEMVLEP